MDIIQFTEQILGLQLLPCQKEMLKMLEQNERIYCVPCAHRGLSEIRGYKDGQTN